VMSLEENFSSLLGVESVLSVEGVAHHELKRLEGRQDFAVVEAGSSTDVVVSGSAHHGGRDSHSRVVLGLGVIHVSPNPKRAGVVGTLIVTGDHLDTIFVVAGFGGLAKLAVGPGDGSIVHVGATVADLIGVVEDSVGVSSVNLHVLARAHLNLHLGGSDGVHAGIELVHVSIEVLGNGDGLDSARSLGAGSVDLGKMNGGDGLDHVEVIVIFKDNSLG